MVTAYSQNRRGADCSNKIQNFSKFVEAEENKYKLTKFTRINFCK